jgi:hypothetical protein
MIHGVESSGSCEEQHPISNFHGHLLKEMEGEGCQFPIAADAGAPLAAPLHSSCTAWAILRASNGGV